MTQPPNSPDSAQTDTAQTAAARPLSACSIASWPRPARILAIALIYVTLAQLALRFLSPDSVVAFIWPLAGLSIGALLMYGRTCWPGIALGAFGSGVLGLSLLGDPGNLPPLLVAMATALGATLQAVIGARVLQPLYRGLIRHYDQTPLLVPSILLVPVVCLVSASIATAARFGFGGVDSSALSGIWFSWWASDSLGVLLIMPLIMAWVLYRRHQQVRAGLVLMLPLLTVALVLSGYYWLARSEQLEVQADLTARGQELSARLSSLYAGQEHAVMMAAAYVASSRGATAASFSEFTQRALSAEGVLWLGWVEPNTEGDRFRLQYAAGPAAQRVQAGLDFSANAGLNAALMSAAQSGQQALVLRPEVESGDGRLLFVPVYRRDLDVGSASLEERRAGVRGFAVGALSLEPATALTGDAVGVRFSLASAQASRVLFERQLPPDSVPDWTEQLHAGQGEDLLLELWSLTPWRPGQSASVKVYLVAAVLAALFATLLTFLAAGQQARVRHEVAHRTAELTQAKARLQRIIDGSRLGFWDWDLVRGEIQYSGCWASMLGYRLEELEHSYETWADLVHPDDKPMLEQAMDDLLQGRCEVYEHDHRLRTSSGDWRWIRTSAGALSRSESGKPLYISGTHTDIHDKKQLELALKASEQQLHEANATLERRVVARTAQLRGSEGFMRALINALNVHIVVLDADGGLITCNESWRAFVENNWRQSQPISRGVNYFSVCGPAEKEGTQAALLIQAVMQGTRKQGTFEYACHSADEQHWFLCKVSCFRVGEGALRIVLSHENITLRKQAEVALKQLNDQLEQRVLARTEQLQQAQQGAEQASQAKSQFLATMSHEIRTPLNGVIGMVDVLEQTRLEAKQKGMVDLIRISGLSLLSIIDDILDFSKIEAGHLELDPAPFSITAMVEQCCAMVDNQASNRGVELRMFTDPRLEKELLGDELRIRQVLLNLASNAIKFSSEGDGGRVSVRISLEKETEQQVRVLLEVVDNGIGMSEKAQASLFTAFKQADASTTRRFGGTGLGLAISLHLVKMMQGEIKVKSATGEGSVFSVSLPLERLPEVPQAPVIASKVAGLNCLMVGSAQSLAEDLQLYLQHAGCVTDRVSSLEEAQRWQLQQGEGLYIWVVDIERQARELPGFELVADVAPGQDLVFVQIERGKRRYPRQARPNRVEVDGNVLSREMLLAAVTYASRREILEPVKWGQPEAVEADVLPTREEALQQGRLILVAEDNKVNQKVLMHQLGLLGYTADIAANGLEALELWRKGDYAVLLTDLHMPEMDGYQLTEALRAEQAPQARLPIIALSANALKGEAQRCKDIGMDDFLSKPARLELLRSMLNKWMPSTIAGVTTVGANGAGVVDEAIAEVDAEVEAEVEAAIVDEPVMDSETDNETESAVLDTAELAALVGDDPEAILELLQDFRHYGLQTSVELLQAHEDGEADGVGAMAHKLKSSARSVGAIRLSEYCEQLEDAARDLDMARIDGLIPLFRGQMNEVDQRIAAL
uniref:ATP-binding protein n=1 Tax=Marinobacterium profundum TaxID=1714300 RepID=UPI00082AFDF5|nr:ATP-binding protein [Marinobacterium profundum]